MKKTKFKYNQNLVRLCVLKVALLFSVFAFSGFNENIEYSFQESVKTELVESIVFKADFSISNFTKNYLGISLTGFQFDVTSYSFYALLHFKKIIVIKYKTALKKRLAYDFSSISLAIKTSLSSSPDEIPHFTTSIG